MQDVIVEAFRAFAFSNPLHPDVFPEVRKMEVCCSVLQRVAACCSVLQRVAVCCSVCCFKSTAPGRVSGSLPDGGVL